MYETVYGALARFVRSHHGNRRAREEPEFRMPAELPSFIQTRREDDVIKALSELFSSYLGVSWLVEVRV
jgi:hypothetical protein